MNGRQGSASGFASSTGLRRGELLGSLSPNLRHVEQRGEGTEKWSRAGLFLLPAAVAVLLCLPGYSFPFLFDDYDFLDRSRLFRVAHLLPDPQVIFYRPISRDLYFGLLSWIAPGKPLAGHALNALFLAGIVVLGSDIASRLMSRRAGLITGLIIGSFGQFPVLVAWVSGVQDLLAIVLGLLAIDLQIRGRGAAALTVFTCAILSKETAVAMAPAFVLVRCRDKRARILSASIPVGIVLVAWALIHPGVHVLLQRGGATSQRYYIGLAKNDQRWTSLLKSIPILLNLPLRIPTDWPRGIFLGATLAVLPFAIGLRFLNREPGTSTEREPSRTLAWAVCIGLLLAIPPLIITCLLVKVWAQYYACFSVIGIAIACGSWGSVLPRGRVICFVAAFFILGIWSRGVEFKAGALTEEGLSRAAVALPKVEENFKRLVPLIPPNSVVCVTTVATGSQSVYSHIYHFQALRVWYWEPTIQTVRPELRVASSGPEYLFVIQSNLNVFQVDPKTLEVRSTSANVDEQAYRSVILSYAIGLAQTGEVDRAVQILLARDPPNSPNQIINRRIAAMLLLSRGDVSAAASLLKGLPELPPAQAFEDVGLLLTVPTRVTHLDEYALEAFGFSPNDPVILHPLLKALLSLGYNDVSRRLADRLLRIRPDDPEAKAAIAHIDSLPVPLDAVTQEAKRIDLR